MMLNSEVFTITVIYIPLNLRYKVVRPGDSNINVEGLFTYMKKEDREAMPYITVLGRGIDFGSSDPNVVIQKVNNIKGHGDVLFIITPFGFD